VKNDYPLADNIFQHIDFYDEWVFIAPKEDQDLDGTVACLQQALNDLGTTKHLKITIVRVDWPTEDSFYEEAIDKKLQSSVINHIRGSYSADTWFHKHDIDEFISSRDQDIILNMITVFNYGVENTMMSTNWVQLVKNTRTYVWDPTKKKNHFVRNIGNISFPGNDASDIVTDVGDDTYLSYVNTYHTGYVKKEDLLTLKIKEHIKLNKSVYADKISNMEIESFKFKFPENVPGTKSWPLGLNVLLGLPNRLEYFQTEVKDLPEVLKKDNWLYFDK